MYYDFIFRGVLTSENSDAKVPITMKLFATDYESAIDDIDRLHYWEDAWQVVTGEEGEKVKCNERQIDCTGSFTTLFSRLKDGVRKEMFPLSESMMYNSQDAYLARKMEQVMFLSDLKVADYDSIKRRFEPKYGEFWETYCFISTPYLCHA